MAKKKYRGATKPNGRGGAYYSRILRHDPCVFCGKSARTIDHIHPSSLGGMNQWWNFAGACERCNGKKGNLSLLGFLMTRNGMCSRKQAMKIKGKHIRLTADELEMPEKWFDPLCILLKNDRDGDFATIRL